MKEKYISFWRHSLEHSKKKEFYKVFKDEYFTSDYLNQLRSFNERRNLVKFRVSNHKLMIELGRYQTDHMPRETRLCPLCKSNQVENQARPQGLLAFQNGGGSGEDPGTQQITCLQRGWRCI